MLSRSTTDSQGSVAYVNRMAMGILSAAGFAVDPVGAALPRHSGERMIPLGLAGRCAAEDALAPADVALYDDGGLALRTPSRHWARHNAVLYHGLAYGAGAWMANPAIDLHCANSPYLASVLRSLFAYPNWRTRTCADSRALARTISLRLPVPCLSAPPERVAFSTGGSLPPEVPRALQRGEVLGHSVQPRKQDLLATSGILYWLNCFAHDASGPRIRLVISAESLGDEQRRQLDGVLGRTGFRCDDFFIVVPRLRQEALYDLMRETRFCLAYNHFPEPLGFYVLESIYHGCPVYTNGAGNNRHLLPAEHGIVCRETPAMAGEVMDAEAYRDVARAIWDDLAAPAKITAACARGANQIQQQWTRDAFADDLRAAIKHAMESGDSAAAAPAFEELVVSLSPLVRLLDPLTGRCLNDYGRVTLTRDAVAQVQQLVRHTCADLDGAAMQKIEDQHHLFRNGVLSLAVPSEVIALDAAGRPRRVGTT